MALMGFREDNKVKWVGVRPGHNGTQVFKDAGASNSTAIIHTVTAGKTFYMTGFTFECNSSFVGGNGTLKVRDAGDVDIVKIYSIVFDAAGQVVASAGLTYPIEIPAGYDIVVSSNNAGLDTRSSVWGWEE